MINKLKIEFLDVVTPSDTAVSAARTCYAAKGLVKPKKSSQWARKDALLSSVFEAGHHTTLQHTHITMMIEGMSRHLIWRLLHAHPFYNSEQVSQRYAKMSSEAFVYPKNAASKDWQEYYKQQFNDYEELIELLMDDASAQTPKFRQKDVVKKAQEMARYVLPGGMSAYLYHTVNVITLLRYIAVAQTLEESADEAKEFADIISKKLIELDSSLKPLVEHAQKSSPKWAKSTLSKIKKRHEIKESEKVRVFDVVGTFKVDASDNYADVLRFSQMIPDEGVLGGFSTYIKLSLSADAQNQRHRKSPAIRPLIEENYHQSFYTPPLIEKNEEALKVYRKSIQRSYDFFEKESKALGFSEAVYALSNAHEIELVERNDFSSFHHKAQMRLCYNAQQEIFDIVYEQVRQLREQNIEGSDEFLPPCTVRAANKIYPICPEGSRFCGVKVWKLDFEDYQRNI